MHLHPSFIPEQTEEAERLCDFDIKIMIRRNTEEGDASAVECWRGSEVGASLIYI
jgi:hypothetical protein